jgi:hypothetical protein
MCTIHIGNLIAFNGAGDIRVLEGAVESTPKKVFDAIKLADQYRGQRDLVDAHCGEEKVYH